MFSGLFFGIANEPENSGNYLLKIVPFFYVDVAFKTHINSRCLGGFVMASSNTPKDVEKLLKSKK